MTNSKTKKLFAVELNLKRMLQKYYKCKQEVARLVLNLGVKGF